MPSSFWAPTQAYWLPLILNIFDFQSYTWSPVCDRRTFYEPTISHDFIHAITKHKESTPSLYNAIYAIILSTRRARTANTTRTDSFTLL